MTQLVAIAIIALCSLFISVDGKQECHTVCNWQYKVISKDGVVPLCTSYSQVCNDVASKPSHDFFNTQHLGEVTASAQQRSKDLYRQSTSEFGGNAGQYVGTLAAVGIPTAI